MGGFPDTAVRKPAILRISGWKGLSGRVARTGSAARRRQAGWPVTSIVTVVAATTVR
jgi:hypothetical protein